MARNLDNIGSDGNSADVAGEKRPKGVTYEKRTGKWGARIKVGGKLKWLGTFDSMADAADAVAVAKQSLGDKYKPRRLKSTENTDLSKKVTGVKYLRGKKKWQAQVHPFGETVHLGLFKTKAEAVEARQKAEEFYNKRIDVARKVRE